MPTIPSTEPYRRDGGDARADCPTRGPPPSGDIGGRPATHAKGAPASSICTPSRVVTSTGRLAQRGHQCHSRQLSWLQRRTRGISTMHHDHGEMTGSEAVTALAELGIFTFLFRL
jgi:hypothetical protein